MNILDRLKRFFNKPKIEIKQINERNSIPQISINENSVHATTPRIKILPRETVKNRVQPISRELEDRMNLELQYFFPEYYELETFFKDMIKHSIESNYNYDCQQKKDLKYLELSQYFKQYCYGMINKKYITHENKEKIISRIKTLKNIQPYEGQDNTYGECIPEGIRFRDCLDEEKGRNLSNEIYAKTFFHELTHYIFSDNFLINAGGGKYPISQSMINKTTNHYYLGAFKNGGFIDELIAQDTAESIYNTVNGITNSEQYSMYDYIRNVGCLFAQSINGCDNIKDLAIKTFDSNWIESIMQEYRGNYNHFVMIMTTLQSKLREGQRRQGMFNLPSSQNSNLRINIGKVNRPDSYIDIDENLRQEDLLSENLLVSSLEQKKRAKDNDRNL